MEQPQDPNIPNLNPATLKDLLGEPRSPHLEEMIASCRAQFLAEATMAFDHAVQPYVTSLHALEVQGARARAELAKAQKPNRAARRAKKANKTAEPEPAP